MRMGPVLRIAVFLSLAVLAAVALWWSSLHTPKAAVQPLLQHTVDRTSGAWRLQQQYQKHIVNETAGFRPKDSNPNGLFVRFWAHWQEEHANGTYMGERIFVPMDLWACVYMCDPEHRAVGSYIHALDRSYKYYMITGMDKGLHMWGEIAPLPADLDMLVFHAGGATRGARNIALPLLRHRLRPKGLAKEVTVSAVTGTNSHGIRTTVDETWQSWGPRDGFVRAEGLSLEDYVSLLERSNFTMAPRGNGVSSFRLFEALLVGTVPIYIWKYTLALPFAELIDWDSIAVIIEIHQVGTLLDAINSFDIVKAQRNMAAVQNMWTFDYVNSYVVKRLAAENQMFAIPKSAFADDPGCDCAPGCGGRC